MITNFIKMQCNSSEEFGREITSKEEICHMLTKYIKLRKLPELFSKLFVSLENNSIEKNWIYPAEFLQDLSSQISYLPAGQILEIWKICLVNGSKLLKNIKKSKNEISINCLNMIAEILRIFILHFKIDRDICLSSKKQTELENITIFIKKFMDICIKKNIQADLGYSILSLCYVWGELHLSMKHYNRFYQFKIEFTKEDKGLFDLNAIHYYFTSQEWTDLLNNFENIKENKIQYSICLLLLQKIRFIVTTLDIESGEGIEIIKKLIKYIIKMLKSCTLNVNAVWNGELIYITSETYSVAMWWAFLKYLPCFIKYFKSEQFLFLCSNIIQILKDSKHEHIFDDGRLTLYGIINEFLKSSYFLEVHNFHSAFILEIWNLAMDEFQSKKRKLHDDIYSDSRQNVFTFLCCSPKILMKFKNTIPKCKSDNECFNELWNNIKNASLVLSDIINSDLKSKANIKNLLKFLEILNYLPLEYLSPGNQMNCILGVITIMTYINETGNSEDKLLFCLMITEVNKIISSIIDGRRSIWLLSFIDITLLLKTCVRIINYVYKMKLESKDLSVQKETLKNSEQLMKSFISLAMKRVDTLSQLEAFIVNNNELQINYDKGFCTFSIILLSKLNDSVCRNHTLQSYDDICQKLGKLLIMQLKKYFKDHNKNELLIIKCYIEIITFECTKKSEEIENLDLKNILEYAFRGLKQENELHDYSLELFVTLCKYKEILKDNIPKNFIEELWLILVNKIFDHSKFSLESINKVTEIQEKNFEEQVDQIHFDIVLNAIEIQNSNSTFHDDIAILDNEISNAINAVSKELNILNKLFICCSSEEYFKIIQDLTCLIDTIDIKNFDMTFFVFLEIWKILLNSSVKLSHQKHLQTSVCKLIIKFHNLIYQLKVILKESVHKFINISMPILNIFSVILLKGKHFITHQYILFCLECCILIPLEQLTDNYHLYIDTFNAIYSILNEIMIHHQNSALYSASTFISYICHFVACQIQASNQEIFVKYNNNLQEKFEFCAQKLYKLLILISEHKLEFSKLVPSIIATYVNEAVKITLFPSIKVHLMRGVYKLIEICDEHSLKTLQNRLKQGNKEVFKTILEEYNSHFKYRGHV